MPTILFAWELGGGLGHLMQMAALATQLAARGHRVVAAVRELRRAPAAFPPGVTLLPAPVSTWAPPDPVRPVVTYAQLLYNVTWGNVSDLLTLCRSWRALYDLVKPDLIVFDHAPTAMLAARGLVVRRVVVGSGFCVPPDDGDDAPPRRLRPSAADDARLAADERRMVGVANEVLRTWEAPPLRRVTELFAAVDETLLLTLPELDHYGPRSGARYSGPVGGDGVRASEPAAPLLSDGPGRSVYAYLKNFPALPALLSALEDGGHRTHVVCDGVPASVKDVFAGARHVRLVDQPLDLRDASGRFDLAITNAGHGATAAMLLAGVPCLLVPLHLEQGMLTRAAVRHTGACAAANARDAGQLVARLKETTQPDRLAQHAAAAHRFAAKYASFDPKEQMERMTRRVEELLDPSGPARERRAARAAVFAG